LLLEELGVHCCELTLSCNGNTFNFHVNPVILCVSVYDKIHVISLVSYQLSIFSVGIIDMESSDLRQVDCSFIVPW